MPIAWHISKVEGVNPLGIMHYTLAQTVWNQHTDVIEYDNDGNVVGMWCDLYKETNLPSDNPTQPDPELSGNYAIISYAGAEPHVKVNGGYKAVTVTYYNVNELLDDQTPGEWSYWIDDTEVSDLIRVLETDSPNTIKIKFLGDENYLGEVLTVKNTRNTLVAELQLQIVSL